MPRGNLCHKGITILSAVFPSNTFPSLMNTCTTSRVIESRIETRSANLVGATKVDGGNQWFQPMCAGADVPERTKPPLMASAQRANHHESFVRPLHSA